MPKFKVLPPSRRVPKQSSPALLLMQDNWNDFGFQTQYHLYQAGDGEPVQIGTVKILRRGQSAEDGPQIQTDFDALPDNYVSVGDSLDYYTRLAELGADLRRSILGALRDVAMHPELESRFASEEGWITSLFRGQRGPDAIGDYLRLARSLVTTDYTTVPADHAEFSFHPSGWKEPVKFDFSPPNPENDIWQGPELDTLGRVVVLIGRNGSGKSTLLFRLARVAFGTATQRTHGVFEKLGSLEPTGLGFPRIIAVSYSAFDSFALPGLPPFETDQPDEREQILNDARRGEGRFIFLGLRDIASELEERISAEPGPDPNPVVADDLVRKTYLKSIESLADEFQRTLDRVRKNGREASFQAALDRLTKDASFSQWANGGDLWSLLQTEARETFLAWSTGQKIVTQILASLAAHIVPRSLVLFDEPETHLHPPLVAALMHAVRHLLSQHKGCAVIATHSPVVVQESLARHVHIVRRESMLTEVFPTTIETFGENVGTLTSEVFKLHSEATDFYRVLDWLIDDKGDLDKIEQYFQPFGLSMQARAYVMSRLSKARNH